MKRKLYSLMGVLVGAALFYQCSTKTDPKPAPPNPFDAFKPKIDTTTLASLPDSSTIEGLHYYIFAKSCATPGCHDGHFEPDFRTVQSSYSSLVYQPVVKNNALGSFTYRVLPGDSSNSWLRERVVTNDAVLGRMPLYSPMLSQNEISCINRWIHNGAKDVFGNDARLPDKAPKVTGYAAFLPTLNNYRVDTLRGDTPSNPFGTLANSTMEIWFDIDEDVTPLQNLKVNQLKLSKSFDDFSQAKTYNAVYSPTPKIVPKFRDLYNGNKTAQLHWKVTVNTSEFLVNDLLFMRYYVQDESHTQATEFPKTGSATNAYSYFAFVVVQP